MPSESDLAARTNLIQRLDEARAVYLQTLNEFLDCADVPLSARRGEVRGVQSAVKQLAELAGAPHA